MTKDEVVGKLWSALYEAVYEHCYACPSWDATNKKCAFRGETKVIRGKVYPPCFLSAHWELLDATKKYKQCCQQTNKNTKGKKK